LIWRCDLVPQYEEYQVEIAEAIERVLRSGRYILAKEVAQFEIEFARYIGVEHAIGVANGTDGLTLSLMVCGIGKGDEVITTPFTAIPTVSAIIDTGATPVFVDVDPETYLLDIRQIGSKITKRTKAIIPVHIFGNVVDIKKLKSIVGDKIPIIEDACQSHGSKINGIQSGSMGDMGVFSFYPTKNLGAYGDGGMIVTNNDALAERARLLRMYGMVDYNHIVMNGINSRLDELQAAILRIKLKYLDKMNNKRVAIAKRYIEKLPQKYFKHQIIDANIYSNYHVFVSRFSGDRKKLVEYLDSKEIQTNIYYLMPLHLQAANKYLGLKKGDFPNAEKICEEVIALTLYPELQEEVQNIVINTINAYLG
jgi:dTDP-4-amino-4,6-dideoxygalactose transaminase